jgi:hypothetical protein
VILVTTGERIAFAIIVLIGLAVALILLPARDRIDASICDPLYRHATTAQESAAIDQQPAPKQRGGGEHQGGILTCGELRRLRAEAAP